jgi:tetratricopeptide (TPR) repeat protein
MRKHFYLQKLLSLVITGLMASGLAVAEGKYTSQAALGWPGKDLKGQPCQNPGREGQPPHDYRNPEHRRDHLPVVEQAHFTRNVQMLVKGERGPLPQDIVYTLRAFPNHTPALYSMMRFEQNKERDAIAESSWPAAECFLQRAIKYDPDNAKLYLLYGNYLKKKKQPEMALENYKTAVSIEPQSADLHLALGYLYFDLERYEEAVSQALKARELGSKKMKLYKKLKNAGKWPAS